MKVSAVVENSTQTMPPSAEEPIEGENKPMLIPIVAPKPADLSKNVISAYNYEVSIVDEFVASVQKRKRASLENEAPSHHILETPKRNTDAEQTRKSTRDKGKREITTVRARVRYDMQKVPVVKRNPDFWKAFDQCQKNESIPTTNNTTRRSSSRLRPNQNTTTITAKCTGTVGAENLPPPFLHESPVLWVPTKRREWEDCLDELTAVCTSAALRKHNPTDKVFLPPLSRDYIRDRVDIDDPLKGYQLRHRTGGWLQGFILYTNFTTWTHGFRWDSRDARSGIDSANTAATNLDDGTLSAELDALPRSGDPLRNGIVFEPVAEIALVGALGCGEYLLRMALEEIRNSGKYKYVVLQATDKSKAFYERFGFVRVGAVCLYMGKDKAADGSEEKLVGYRHWTHANESELSLNLHGGPSYMMGLKMSDSTSNATTPSILDVLKPIQEAQKPTIKPLGGGMGGPMSPQSSRGIRRSYLSPTGKKKLSRRGSTPQRRKSVVGLSAEKGMKRMMSDISGISVEEGHGKRRKTSGADLLLTPLPIGPLPLSGPSSLLKAQDGVNQSISSDPKARKLNPTNASPQYKTCMVGGKERLYHSIRGPDGRFTRVYADGTPADKPVSTPKATNKKTTSASKVARKKGEPKPPDPAPPVSLRPGPIPVPLAKGLQKQKVRSYPRTVVHYYNRVVKPTSREKTYFFVLNYNPLERWIRAVPLLSKSIFSGQREGRPRYQAVLEPTDANLLSASVDDYQVVSATMVMKTPVVSEEAWDVIDD